MTNEIPGSLLIGVLAGYIIGLVSSTLVAVSIWGHNLPDWTMAPAIVWVVFCSFAAATFATLATHRRR